MNDNYICDVFHLISERVYSNLETAQSLNYQISEETITDLNSIDFLLSMKALPYKISYNTFTKSQESKNGADWEWWIKYGKQWLGFRVQAKVLHVVADKFKNKFKVLHYQQKNGTYQKDLLLQVSNQHNLIPLYCYYSTGYRGKSYGCSLSSLSHVQALFQANKENRLKPVLNGAYPWCYLVCHSNNLDKIPNIIGNLFPEYETCIHEELPERVLNLLNIRDEDEIDELKIEDNFFEDEIDELGMKNLAGIIVIEKEKPQNSEKPKQELKLKPQ